MPHVFFGQSLSSGDYNGDDRDDLVIGIPWSDPGGVQDAGAVEILHGSSSGLSATSPIADQFWIQGAMGLADLIEVDDIFGRVL